MGTAAAIGVARAGGGWDGTYVGYSGDPENLGEALLDLIADHRGDLRAAWEKIAAAPGGWRHAFSDAYALEDNLTYFDTGRSGLPLLCSEDGFVRQQVVYWYILDFDAR